MNSIMLRNCTCLDPQHGIAYEPRDLAIMNGLFKTIDMLDGSIDQELDVEGKITIPGGIFPSFEVPVPGSWHVKTRPSATVKALLSCGFTTLIADGISPFITLDAHRYFQHLPCMNKVPFIDVGNFQFMTSFLKNGVTNYAMTLENILLQEFKGYGISCMNPGTTLRWHGEQSDSKSIFEPLPFLGMSVEKVISEQVASHVLQNKGPALIVETGIEGMPGSIDDCLSVLKE